MKKLATLLLAAGMVVASTAPANAVDVKVDGRYRFSYSTGETGFKGENNEMVQQRLRLGLTFTASENLAGYVQFQDGKDVWGTAQNTHGKHGNFVTRQAFIDWKVPATPVKVRMGRHALGLPADAFGNNAILCSGWGVRDGIVVSSPVTNWLDVTAMWSRIGHHAVKTEAGFEAVDRTDNNDFFALVANLKFDGVSGSVYGAYAALDASDPKVMGAATDANFTVAEGDAYWLGFTSTFSFFDPFTLKFSAAYGEFNSNDKTVDDQDGWNVQAKASYALPFGTPVLGAWYFSGNDKDGEGLMPSLGGYFVPTRTYHDAANGLNGGLAKYLPSGNWGVQTGIEGMSFLTDLSHDVLVTYMQGTNDEDWDGNNYEYLSEKDSLVSLDFISTYKIYKNLAAHLELSYIISDFNADAKKDGFKEDDWRAELTFDFKF